VKALKKALSPPTTYHPIFTLTYAITTAEHARGKGGKEIVGFSLPSLPSLPEMPYKQTAKLTRFFLARPRPSCAALARASLTALPSRVFHLLTSRLYIR
jgi:hypothetical protein